MERLHGLHPQARALTAQQVQLLSDLTFTVGRILGTAEVNSLAFDGRWLVAGLAGGHVHVWDPGQGGGKGKWGR